MATVQLEKVQEFLTCTICADKYTDPCTLNCQHTLCTDCITKYTKTRPEALQSKTIPCPICRQLTKVPDTTKPADRWAWQIKPEITIPGLTDTSEQDKTSSGDACNVCQHLRATTTGDIRKTDTAVSKQLKEIIFSQDSDKGSLSLDGLHLGQTEVKHEGLASMASTKICGTIDAITKKDQKRPGIVDMTVLVVDDVHTLVVTDYDNMLLKSFHTSNKTCISSLLINTGPWGISVYKGNQVMVTVPDSKQIITVQVTTDLVLISTMKPSRMYCGVAVISPSFLAAGSWQPDDCVDILNTTGEVMKSISIHNNVRLFDNIWCMCVDRNGNILASDYGSKKVTCLTPSGYILWQRIVGNCKGITTNSNGDILIAMNLSKKVIQLTERGQSVRDVLTSADGLSCPNGICMGRSGSVFVCERDQVKEFKFV